MRVEAWKYMSESRLETLVVVILIGGGGSQVMMWQPSWAKNK